MSFISAYNRMGNARAASDSSYAMSTSPTRILQNMNAAANGDLPVFSAHQNENKLTSDMQMADLQYEIAMARKESLKKQAKDAVKRSFTI